MGVATGAMSGRFTFDHAWLRAQHLRALLEPYCERIEIAGSLRRGISTVKDIELVAIPLTVKVKTGLFSEMIDIEDKLEQRIAEAIAEGWLTARDVAQHRKGGDVVVVHKMGERYKALEYDSIPCDLFVVRPPADWGVIYTLRTGPADFSARLVTAIQDLFMRVEDGHLIRSGQVVSCPEERDFFAAIGQPWLEPRDRRADRVMPQRALVR